MGLPAVRKGFREMEESMYSDVINIKAQEYGGIRVIYIKGELDSFTSESLRSVAKTWLKDASRLVVNLDALEYIDSAGLSTLVGIWVETKNAHVQMVISCNNPRIHRILEITGLVNLFTMDEPETSAAVISKIRQPGIAADESKTKVQLPGLGTAPR
jgi:anti-sigma B factor antagonist